MSKYLNTSIVIDTEEKALKFEQAIKTLKELNLDVEATEVMLHELGTGDLIYGNLVGEQIFITANKVWEDIFNNDTLTYNNFDDYFNNEFLPNL